MRSSFGWNGAVCVCVWVLFNEAAVGKMQVKAVSTHLVYSPRVCCGCYCGLGAKRGGVAMNNDGARYVPARLHYFGHGWHLRFMHWNTPLVARMVCKCTILIGRLNRHTR
jgi:hypothetical protein